MKTTIIAHPNSKNPRIETDLLNQLHIYVSAPPLENKANQAIIKALSQHYQIKPNRIHQTSGFKNKTKTFKIQTN